MSEVNISRHGDDFKVDLFYKTCKKDEEWLNYSLRSVRKFAEGFRQIVIVTDKGHNYNPPGNLKIKMIELDLPPNHYQYEHGIGYWWQMGVKLSWNHFTDSDAVVIIDSDCIFYNYVSPSNWKLDGKFVWLRRPWSEVGGGIVWKPGTDYFLGKETKYSHMVFQGFYITRDALAGYQRFMVSRFAQKPITYFIDLRHPYKPEEYESFGAYLDEIDNHGYSFYHPDDLGNKIWPIKQFWSWGGLNEEIRNEIEQIIK